MQSGGSIQKAQTSPLCSIRSEMCQKSKEVSKWLKGVLGEAHVPWFELNKCTINILHKLSKNSEQQSRDIDLLVEDFKLRTGEYKTEGTYHQGVLCFALGEYGSCEMLEPVSCCLNSLECIAEGFKLKDTKVGGLLASTYNQTKVLLEEKEEKGKLQNKLLSLEKKRMDVLHSQKCLLKTISETQMAQDMECVETEERLLCKDFMEKKYQEMSSRVRGAQERLVSREVSPSLTHHSVQEISEQLSLLKQEMEPVKRKLQAYYGLPPSIPLAHLAVAESKKELATLDAILDENIDWRHT